LIRKTSVLLCLAALGAGAQAATCDNSFSEVFESVSPSVVRVFTVSVDPSVLLERVQMVVGTGVVVDDEGHFVTNAHVVFEANEIMVSIGDDELLPATVVGMDPLTDLAVLELAFPFIDLPPAVLGNSADLRIGDPVMAIGYPFGMGKTATTGIISALERVVPLSPFSWRAPFVQTDTAINPGNSGGPLVDSCGEVIAINTLSSEIGQNLSFALPIDLVRELLPELIENGHVSRAWHGINGRIVPFPLAMALDIPPGFLVETVEPGSPADAIGINGGTFPIVLAGEEYLLGGDILLSVNGEPLMDMETVSEIALSLEVGATIELEYMHEGEIVTTEVELPERPLLPSDIQRFRQRRSMH